MFAAPARARSPRKQQTASMNENELGLTSMEMAAAGCRHPSRRRLRRDRPEFDFGVSNHVGPIVASSFAERL